VSALASVCTVASFELRRVFKLKDVAVTLVMFCCGALGFAWLRGLDTEPAPEPITVVGDALVLEDADHLPFRFVAAGEALDEDEARRRVASDELETVVFARSVDDVEVLIRDEAPAWYPELVACVTAARRAARVRAAGLSAGELEAVFAESPVALTVHAPEDADRERKLRLLAGLCIGALMLGLFMGSVYLFTGITGEKQSHVTGSVLSAIPVQSWIDGKCLGLALASLASLLSVAGSWWVANGVYGLFREPLHLPIEIVDAGMLAGLAAIAALGFVMWFAFFAAIAATIDDPNTSSRGMFMFLPAAATGLGFVGMGSPDSILFRAASLFPLTSPSAMSARLVVGEPAAWEVAGAVLLLLAATWLFRRAAAKVFGMAMLMRGKELAWRELGRAFTGA